MFRRSRQDSLWTPTHWKHSEKSFPKDSSIPASPDFADIDDTCGTLDIQSPGLRCHAGGELWNAETLETLSTVSKDIGLQRDSDGTLDTPRSPETRDTTETLW